MKNALITKKIGPARLIRPSIVPWVGLCLAALAQAGAAEDVLPRPEAPFKGHVAFRAQDSTPDWPTPVTAPAGAPNIILILLDDVGFGATSTFGGPVQTPDLDRLAAQGLRYNRFHVTAICSPTRAALLSGRNQHRLGAGTITTYAAGYPGYNANWRRDAATIAQVLSLNGYSTAAFGKWHNAPVKSIPEIYPTGPYGRWPTGMGFEYFYGFLGAEADQWEPTLYRNTTLVDPPGKPEQGYYLNADLVNDAIRWVHTHEALAPQKPYFLYFAPGATHVPHQAPKEWIDKYRGQFDQGWDKVREETFARQKKLGVIPANSELTPRPKELPAWDSLTPDEQKLCAREMEVYAGYLAETDYDLGRFLRSVQQGPEGDNTLILYIAGDNGAEAGTGRTGTDDGRYHNGVPNPESIQHRLEHLDELGGPKYLSLYASGWAWAMCAPFQWVKTIGSHLGGTRDPLIVSWPARIKDRGGLRSQYTHVNDMASTIYEVVGVPIPGVVNGVKQLSMDGTSFAYTFADAAAPSRHTMQVYESFDNRAMYKDGWIAAIRHTIPWIPVSPDFSHDRWELYHLDVDFTEAHDLAAQEPARLKDLQTLFEAEARKNQIYPMLAQTDYDRGLPSAAAARKAFVFLPDMPPIPSEAAPRFERSHRITVKATIPSEGAEGTLVCDGTRLGGFVLYIKDHHLVYENNSSDVRNLIVSNSTVPSGPVEIAYEFVREGGQAWNFNGTGRLYINQALAGEAKFPIIGAVHFGTFDIGETRTSRISPDYELPFRFTGTIEQVRVDLK